MSTPVIAIIGGGFCGMVTAVHLCRDSKTPLHIRLINKGNPFARGVAYSAHSKQYLLNVRAKGMSAFAGEPHHFIQWLLQQPAYSSIDAGVLANEFLPRSVYGDYLEAIWQQTLQQKPGFITVEQLDETAVDIHHHKQAYQVLLNNKTVIDANYIVLATGNSLPRMPAFAAQHYSQPWTSETVSHTEKHRHILIAGNGLTMADTVIGLLENGYPGVIHTISPNGFALQPHAAPELRYTIESEAAGQCTTLREWKKQVYKHIALARKAALPASLVIEALRPYTTTAWQKLSLAEQQQFLRHSGHHWNILRHRLPGSIHNTLHQLHQQQRFVPRMGFITQAVADETGDIQVSWYNRKNRQHEQLTVQKLINCTGPDTDIAESSNPLLSNLSSKGFIRADHLKLGIRVHEKDFTIIDATGHNHKNICTLGNNLKGLLWESTAVPELRQQCLQTAQYLLHTLSSAQ